MFLQRGCGCVLLVVEATNEVYKVWDCSEGNCFYLYDFGRTTAEEALSSLKYCQDPYVPPENRRGMEITNYVEPATKKQVEQAILYLIDCASKAGKFDVLKQALQITLA